MKSNPLLLAITFLLGCLVTLVAIDTVRQPVQAASSAGAAPGIKGLNIVTTIVDNNKELIVVFKEVDNHLDQELKPGVKGIPKVTAMAVYEVIPAGRGSGKLVLVASRYVDYDLAYHDWENKGGKTSSVNDMRKYFQKKWKE